MMEYFKLYLKGFLMGTADIIPGISGGTVALLLGIYQRFIQSLAEIKLQYLLQLKIKLFIRSIDLTFFIPLFLGIVSAVFSLSHTLSWLLSDYPILIWSLFFGLVLTSVLYLIVEYQCFKPKRFVSLLLGVGIGLLITLSQSIALPLNPLSLFVGGALASFAMILPGISGSYILLLVGLYKPVLSYVKGFQLLPLSIFCVGVGLGILFGSKFLKGLFSKFPYQVYSVLFGFILGSLVKVWPWHSVSGEVIFPTFASNEDLFGIGIMLVAAVSVCCLMRLNSNK